MQDKVLTAAAIPQRSPDTFGHTIRRMREKKLTFAEAITSEDFFIVDKPRLRQSEPGFGTVLAQ